tara:strand:- start:1588 stop:1965 length:378 start_codon:yes stop_codon:yes gene_type:complete
MIFGIGTDVVDINRIKSMDSLSSFANKILSENEIKVFSDLKEGKQATYLSKQFAGKEAISKAIGTGISGDIKFKEIEILRDERGRPIFNPVENLKEILANLGITKTHVSLSDEKDYAIAFAILEK